VGQIVATEHKALRQRDAPRGLLYASALVFPCTAGESATPLLGRPTSLSARFSTLPPTC